MRARTLILAAIVGLAKPGVAQEDGRVAVDPTQYPWSAIGAVVRKPSGLCSGALIARDRVLTAAHCVLDTETGKVITVDRLNYLFGLTARGFRQQRGVRSVFAPHAEAIPTRRPSERDIPGDWAILTLSGPVPGRLLPVGPLDPARAIHGEIRLVRAGFGVKPNALRADTDCRFLGWLENRRALITDCVATPGDSGSPILQLVGEEYRVVGITSAIGNRGQTRTSAAVYAPAIPLPQ